MSFLFLLAQAADKAPVDQAPPAWTTFMPIILMVVIGYLLLFRPMQKQEKDRKAMVSAMKKNDRVVTQAGIIATVVKVDEGDQVVLKIDENANVRMRVLKSSIARVLPAVEESSAETKEDKE